MAQPDEGNEALDRETTSLPTATPIRQCPTTETNGQPSMSSTPAASAPESSLPTATPTMQLPRTETNGQPRMSNTPVNNQGIQDADNVPRVGKGFQSEEEAYQFYNSYAQTKGFSIRKCLKFRADGTLS